MIKRILAGAAILVVGASIPALAQSPRAGVVTVSEGTVTARRESQSVPLKFRDDVRLLDTVVTQDSSLARMLLGDKAVVTVRERSSLTITRVPPSDVITADAGKFGLAVARERMGQGDRIDVRTPNAVAAVRGTVLVTEIIAAREGRPVSTKFSVLRGSVEVRQLNRPGPPVSVGANEEATVSGNNAPVVAPIRGDQVSAILAGLQPASRRGIDTSAPDDIKARALENARTLVTFIAGGEASVPVVAGPVTEPQLAILTPLSASRDIRDVLSQVDGSAAGALGTSVGVPSSSTGEAPLPGGGSSGSPLGSIVLPVTPIVPCVGCPQAVTGTVTISGVPFLSFTGSFLSLSPLELVTLDAANVTQTGSLAFIDAQGGATDVTLSGPLMALVNSSVTTASSFLNVSNLSSITTTGTTSPLITLDPSSITATGAIVAVTGSDLNLSGPLLSDVGGTLSSGLAFFKLLNADVVSTAASALMGLSGTTVTAPSLIEAFTFSFVTLQDAALLASGSTLSFATDAVNVFFSTISSSGAADLLRLVGGTQLSVGRDVLNLDGNGAVNLTGGLLELVDAQLAVGRHVVRVADRSIMKATEILSAAGSTLTVTGDLVRADSKGTLLVDGELLSLGDNNTMTFGGTLATAMAGGLVLTTGPTFEAVGVNNSISFTSGAVPTGTIFGAPVSETNGGFVSLGPTPGVSGPGFVGFAADGLGSLVMIDPIVLPNGPFITFNANGVFGGGTIALLTSAGAETAEPIVPAVNAFNVSIAGREDPAQVGTGRGQGIAQVAGPVVKITNASLTGASGDLFGVSGTALAIGGALLEMQIATIDNTAGPGALLTLTGRSLLRTFGTAPLIAMNQSSLHLGGNGIDVMGTSLTGAAIALTGPLLVAANSSMVSAASDFLLVSQGTVTSTTSQALVQISASTLSLGGAFLQAGCGSGCGLGQVVLAGPLLQTTSGDLTIAGPLVTLPNGEGKLTSTSGTSLVTLNAGLHTLGSASGVVFSVVGSGVAAELDPDAPPGMLVGTSSPLAINSTLFEAPGAIITSGNISSPQPFISVDQALLSATRPLVKLASAVMSHNGDLIGLGSSGNAKVAANLLPGDALVKLDAGTLMTVTNGSLVGVNNGSFLKVVGNLVSLANASTLTITSGALVSVANGSLFKLTGGSLIVKDALSTVSINGAPVDTTISGIPVHLTNSALASQVTVAPGFTPFVGGAPIGTGAVLIVDGTTAKVVLGP